MLVKVNLYLKEMPSLPVEAEGINPENVTGKSAQDIKRLPVWRGRKKESVGDYFDVEILTEELSGEVPASSAGVSSLAGIQPTQAAELFLKGDLSRFKRLGQGMAKGKMIVEGSAGFHTGALMKGGVLSIKGNAGDWLGAQMEGGHLEVAGSAGHFLGAAYRGQAQGMTGGTILVRGQAGQMVGARMRRGLIGISGDCGDAPGFGMLAGTLVLGGTPGIRVGARMKRGTILLFHEPELLPTFYYDCNFQPLFWRILSAHLLLKGFHLPADCGEAVFHRYSGDANEGGKGEILTCPGH